MVIHAGGFKELIVRSVDGAFYRIWVWLPTQINFKISLFFCGFAFEHLLLRSSSYRVYLMFSRLICCRSRLSYCPFWPTFWSTVSLRNLPREIFRCYFPNCLSILEAFSRFVLRFLGFGFSYLLQTSGWSLRGTPGWGRQSFVRFTSFFRPDLVIFRPLRTSVEISSLIRFISLYSPVSTSSNILSIVFVNFFRLPCLLNLSGNSSSFYILCGIVCFSNLVPFSHLHYLMGQRRCMLRRLDTGSLVLCLRWFNFFYCRQLEQLNGALINGLEARVSQIEDKLEDLDARTSEEAENALNEREMDRFIMSGNMILLNIGFLLFYAFLSLICPLRSGWVSRLL